jgi:hypothetical protein
MVGCGNILNRNCSMDKTNTKNLEPHAHQPLKRMVVFALLNALVPLIALAFYAYLGQRETTINTAKRDATYVSEVAANIYKEKIIATKSILKTISRLPEITSNQPAPCNRLLMTFLKEYPSYVNFGVIDENGFVYCSGFPSGQNVDVKDRSWYREALKNGDFSAGLYQIGRITKEETVNFGYPVALAYPLVENGKISKVVFAALRLDWIQTTAENFSLPEGSTITVTDREGTIIAHFPDGADFVGADQKDNPLVKKILSGEEKGSLLEKGFDGIERYYSYVKIREALSSGDFYLYIGIPKAYLDTNANKNFINSLIVILGIVAFSVLIILISWKKFIDKKPISP